MLTKLTFEKKSCRIASRSGQTFFVWPDLVLNCYRLFQQITKVVTSGYRVKGWLRISHMRHNIPVSLHNLNTCHVSQKFVYNVY